MLGKRALKSVKPMGNDTIQPKIIQMLNDDICNNIESIANSMVAQSMIPDQAKVSSVIPVFKKDDRMEKRIRD